MNDSSRPEGSRREFFSGRILRKEVEWFGEQLANHLDSEEERSAPDAGPTVRMGTRAMATEFAVLLNAGSAPPLSAASQALEQLHGLEMEMSVYREEAELARANRSAAGTPFTLSPRLSRVVSRSLEIATATNGAFDPTSGLLIALWKAARDEGRIPTQEEIGNCLKLTGYNQVNLDQHSRMLSFECEGIELNLGGIGKGFALDEIGQIQKGEGVTDWLVHGGKSSLLASGTNANCEGWPVGIRNPLMSNKRLATLLLRDQGMSTSGAGIQFFRHEGKRYGHLLDPRTGWPAEDVLSVTVLAPTAAEADALSTAFFVLGLEKTREFCDNRPDVGVLLAPPPRSGNRLNVYAFNIPEQTLFLGSENELISEPE